MKIVIHFNPCLDYMGTTPGQTVSVESVHFVRDSAWYLMRAHC